MGSTWRLSLNTPSGRTTHTNPRPREPLDYSNRFGRVSNSILFRCPAFSRAYARIGYSWIQVGYIFVVNLSTSFRIRRKSLHSVPENHIHLLLCPAMDYLWTPWRFAYITNAEKTPGCVFCQVLEAGDDEKVRIVFRGAHCFIILNTYPYTSGHAMIVPYQHLDELQKLPAQASQEMMQLSQRMEGVLRHLYNPDGVNLG